MATGRMTWNIEDYLQQLLAANEDVDSVVTELLDKNADYIGGLMYHNLRATSEEWTGAAARTLFVTPVNHDGNFIYIELGANISSDRAALYKEYGRTRQAAEPFLRPTLIFLRRKDLRRLMEKLLEKMGLST